MPTLSLPKDRAVSVDRISFQAVLAGWVRGLGPKAFVAIGVATFLIALVFTLPASLALNAAGVEGRNAVGTIWNGEAALGDQTAIAWRVRPARSLLRLGIVTTVTLRGGETDIAGDGVWRPGRLTLENLAGMAGPGLVNVLIADLPIRCDLGFAVDFKKLVIAGAHTGADGKFRSGPGQCSARNGIDAAPSQIPAMVGNAIMNENGSSAWLAPAATPDSGRLVQMQIDRTGKLTATVLEAGALILPATAGRMEIETQL